jgi:hypothetical protein
MKKIEADKRKSNEQGVGFGLKCWSRRAIYQRGDRGGIKQIGNPFPFKRNPMGSVGHGQLTPFCNQSLFWIIQFTTKVVAIT